MRNKPTILVAGEKGWPKSRTAHILNPPSFTDCSLRAQAGLLEALDDKGEWKKISGVIWRGQFDLAPPADGDPITERALLEMIAYSEVPCCNRADVVLTNGSRLTNHNALRRADFPVANLIILKGKFSLDNHPPSLPAVIKVGDRHMGYGKAKITSKEAWLDAVDMASISPDPVSIEPFFEYKRDLRCLCFFGRVLTIERVPSQWKANVCPKKVKLVSAPKHIHNMSIKATEVIGADVLGVDWIQLVNGDWVLLEANISPGLVVENKDLRGELTRHFAKQLKSSS